MTDPKTDYPQWERIPGTTAPFTCKFCGAPSWVDPSDQTQPADYCHDGDHQDGDHQQPD